MDDLKKSDLVKKPEVDYKELYEQLLAKQNANATAEPERVRPPGITEVDEEGKYKRRKRENSFGITDLMMPPYTKKVVAIYRILNQDVVNDATGLKPEPVDVMIPGRYTLFDRFELNPLNKRKVIRNVTGTERYIEGGEEKVREKVDDIVFQGGYLQVSVEAEYPLYVLMELHPMNKSNKWKPRNSPVVFERVDVRTKSSATRAEELNLSVDAANAVRNMSKDELYAAAIPALVDTTKGRHLNDIKADLMRWAMANPIEFYKLNKNHAAAVKINVIEAMNLGLIDYRPDKKRYVLSTTEEPIHSHTAGEDAMESLVKFLAKKENEKMYEKLMKQLNFWSDEPDDEEVN